MVVALLWSSWYFSSIMGLKETLISGITDSKISNSFKILSNSFIISVIVSFGRISSSSVNLLFSILVNSPSKIELSCSAIQFNIFWIFSSSFSSSFDSVSFDSFDSLDSIFIDLFNSSLLFWAIVVALLWSSWYFSSIIDLKYFLISLKN